MKLTEIPFGITDWQQVEPVERPGDRGRAFWRTREFGTVRVWMVEYSRFRLTPGVSYQVADDAEPHRSSTRTGAKLFIVD